MRLLVKLVSLVAVVASARCALAVSRQVEAGLLPVADPGLVGGERFEPGLRAVLVEPLRVLDGMGRQLPVVHGELGAVQLAARRAPAPCPRGRRGAPGRPLPWPPRRAWPGE
jgi:hypothetical protein